MILPIVAYGNSVLRKKAVDVNEDYPELDKLIKDMWDTMYNANGIGLAAPQVGKSIRLFVVDSKGFDDEKHENFKKVFINPVILEEEGEEWTFNEGCLSIPGIREDVIRKPNVTIEYLDENFELQEETYEGIAARIIQHEYDHIEGVLFIDRLAPLTKKMLKSRLGKITRGDVNVQYKMRFPGRK